MAWLTPAEFQRQYHLSRRTVQALLRDPSFPAARVTPHRWRIATSGLDAWLAAHRNQNPPGRVIPGGSTNPEGRDVPVWRSTQHG